VDRVMMRHNRVAPMTSCTLDDMKGLVSDGDDVYSPKLSKNKNANMINSAMLEEAIILVAMATHMM